MEMWYTKDLGDGIMATMPAEEIKQAFEKLYQAAGEPPSMAVFTRLESDGRLQCELIAYFSPAAREVAMAFGALPCEKPVRAGLGLLSGAEQSWSVLFSDEAG